MTVKAVSLLILTIDRPDGQAVEIQKFLPFGVEDWKAHFLRFICRLKYALYLGSIVCLSY